jgi:hypothetical protein
VTSESSPPPPIGGGGGNLKYGIIGVVLIGAAAAVWFGMKGCEEDPQPQAATPTVVDAGAPVERSTALADDDLLIPELEPDAGPPPDAGRRVRYVTRYVGGGGGSWACNGQIDPGRARAALSQHNLQFRNCYERRLKVNQTLEGRVSVQMRVGRNGRVTAVRTGGTLRDAQVLSCVRSIAQRIEFPQPSGGCAVVAAPFNFTPRR